MKATVHSFLAAVLLLASAAWLPAQAAGVWTNVTTNAAFSPRDTADPLVFNGKMWLSNGWAPNPPLVRDLWSSTDGANWTLVNSATPYDGWSAMVVYAGKIWAILGSVWSSTDGVSWTKVADTTPFGVRSYGHVVVFDNKMWQLGSGTDVWYSTDGVNWTCATQNAPYGVRQASAVIAFGGKLWLMGGAIGVPNMPLETTYPAITTYNDVWSSSDGVNWVRVVEHAPWAARKWFNAEQYLGQMWIAGGLDNVNGRNLGDVWYSSDGINWTPFVQNVSFSPRHDPAMFVFNNSLWVVAGNGWPVVNDVWRLTLSNLPVPQQLLNISKSGTGRGTVTTSPAGIGCSDGCQAFDLNTVVTLTAAATSGSFAGWTGEGCSGTGTCIVTMSQAGNVDAKFWVPGFLPNDFNADGKTDIYWRKQSGQVMVRLMDGAAKLRDVPLSIQDPDMNWQIAGVADFDGDGHADILWRNYATGRNYIWFMNGTSYVRGADTLGEGDVNWRIVGTGDFDGDGSPDLMWRNSVTGQDYVWFMNGPNYARGAWMDTVADVNWSVVGIGDFDGDGKPDLLWRNSVTGQNYIWFMNGSAYARGSWITGVSESTWHVASVGDFDGDGHADILWHNVVTGGSIIWFMNAATLNRYQRIDDFGSVDLGLHWRNTSTGEVSIWLLDQMRRVDTASLGVVDKNWRIVGAPDADGDGQADILWRNSSTGDNYIWFMHGTTFYWGTWLDSVPDVNWEIVGVGDLNGDGNWDILWRNSATGDDYVWFMNGTSHIGGGSLPSVADTDWKIAGVADFDGDGKSDIVLRNSATGQDYVWLMNGVSQILWPGSDQAQVTLVISSAVPLDTNADANMKIAALSDFNGDGKPDILWRNTSTGDNCVWLMNGVARANALCQAIDPLAAPDWDLGN